MKTKHNPLLWLFLPIVTLILFSCSDHDGDDTFRMDVRKGIIIVNEGSYYSQINGSMDFLDFTTGQLQRNVFDKVNLRTLGGTPNNAIVCGGKLFVATTDENRVEVLNARTLKAAEPVVIPQPREMCTDGTAVYVSSYSGKVYKINAATAQIAATSEVVGAQLEGIAAAHGYVYVANSCNPDYTYNTNVVKLNAGNLAKVKDVTVAANPNVLATDGENVFVCSWGNYYDVPATAQKIDAADQVTVLANAQYMAYHGGSLYLIHAPWGGTTTYQRYDVQSQSLSTLPIGTEVFSPCNIGVDPLSGDIYVSSLSENPDSPGSASYTTDGYLVRYSQSGQFIQRYEVGVIPGTLLFVNN